MLPVFLAALLTMKQIVWRFAYIIQHAVDSCPAFICKSDVTKFVSI